jgi:hypothetical protein
LSFLSGKLCNFDLFDPDYPDFPVLARRISAPENPFFDTIDPERTLRGTATSTPAAMQCIEVWSAHVKE